MSPTTEFTQSPYDATVVRTDPSTSVKHPGHKAEHPFYTTFLPRQGTHTYLLFY